jgi:tRNA 2-thiocytidine biosynthesis protein TtcA
MSLKQLSQYQKRHIQFVNNKVAKAIMDNELIAKGEKVLVAVSGGKDSLVLLEALSTLRKYDFLDFDIEAIHIDVQQVPYKTSRKQLEKICDELSISINFVDINIELENTNKSPCFVCSWNRRKALFTYAEENGFKKLALGHHMDDAVETLIINMAYHGNISSIPAKLSMFNDAITIIRPLILLSNKDTQEYANIRRFPKQTESCPYEDKTKRTTSRNLVKQMEMIHPKAARNIFRSMNNIDEEYLP